jgi:hypothetical protein
MILRPQLSSAPLAPAETDAGVRSANTRAFDPWAEPAQAAAPGTTPAVAMVAPTMASAPPSVPRSEQPSALPGTEVRAVELRLQHAGGNAEILSLPWRLAAVGALSQSFMRTVAALPEKTPDSSMHVVGPAGLSITAPDLAVAGRVAASIGMPRADGLPASVSLPHVLATVLAGEEDGAPERARHLALPAEPWLERLCRWIERREREPSIWVRDYRLDLHQAHMMASSLQALARERGVTLGRIVINGRETWNASQPIASPEQPPCQ